MFQTKIIAKNLIAEKTILIRIEKPIDFEFKAGQFAEFFVTLESKLMQGHYFTICSAPNDDYLEFATRLTGSQYKNALDKLNIDDYLEFNGPMGYFNLDSNLPAIFLTGGIGITPFRSFLREKLNQDFTENIYLFFSNRNIKSVPFLNELNEIKNDKFKFIQTLTQQKENWAGDTGYINSKLLHKYIENKDWENAKFYIAGPTKMVESMLELLKTEQIEKDRIKHEEFLGY